jgi:hypothetical protein
MTTFGVIMFGEGRKAKIRCRSNGVTKPRVTMTGDTVSKMRCASAILAELARGGSCRRIFRGKLR